MCRLLIPILLLLLLSPWCPFTVATGQEIPIIQSWLHENQTRLGLTPEDITGWSITSSSTDKKGVTYIYLKQEVNGLPVHGAVASFAVRDGGVVHFGDRMLRDVRAKAPAPMPALDAVEALRRVARALDAQVGEVHVSKELSPVHVELTPGSISHDTIPARLVYQPLRDGSLRLAWHLVIRSTTTPNWWDLAVDAITGELIRNNDRIVHCQHEHGSFSRPYSALDDLAMPPPMLAPPPPDGATYRVFPYPLESPSHGPRVLSNAPADAVASPFGWHDTDGSPGAEFTITRGNNVYAYEDVVNSNLPGYSPDGGSMLVFDHPYDQDQQPLTYLDASITNLFHACNVLHDVWYRYGFDEQSGNFQANNYSNGGVGGDPVIAEAQDGGGMNNANFGTPEDGQSGRMQMYLYRLSPDSTLFINSPPAIAGVYANEQAGFGPPLPIVPITADVVLAVDAVEPIHVPVSGW